jgi:DNA polymerase elongation subunit (family B)
VPYDDYGYSSKFLEGTIVTYLHRKGIIVTNKPAGGREMMNDREDGEDDGFAGAFVKEPKPGLYEWIYSLDLQSLYPSLIMSLNISKETKVGKVSNYSVDEHLNNSIELYDVELFDGPKLSINREKFLKFMEDGNLIISSNGILYKAPVRTVVGKILSRK